jgi:hypothetical protein
MPRDVNPTAAGFKAKPNNSILLYYSLVATSGMAAADVVLSGSAEMGISGCQVIGAADGD